MVRVSVKDTLFSYIKKAYGQSKTANALFAIELDRREKNMMFMLFHYIQELF